MNSNETSILPHAVTLPIVVKAQAFTARVLDEKGDDYPATSVLLDMVALASDNIEYELEFRVAKDGYQIAFPQSVEADMVLDDLDRALEVLTEMVLED
ncbi:hypothetical protein SEA_SANASANA_41 [Microbacterium phage SanaSana]|uniref:hypothetical protein n=1 Tax=Microbacterium phage Stoor TaxID=2829393 RepID=UPI001BEE48B8|nr:hypothetical protein QDW21_gp39 [Microbacterium phage Stoor]QUE26079.1 hypothetical protein SEA_STOOR_39 [Microbacterium phage Stoor]